MSSCIFRLFCKSLLYIHNAADDDVWNIETIPKTEKRCCVFKDNCFICANKTVW